MRELTARIAEMDQEHVVLDMVQVAPEQVAGFRHPQTAGIEQPKQNAITWFCFGGEDPLNVLLSEDPAGASVSFVWVRPTNHHDVDWPVFNDYSFLARRIGVTTRESGARFFTCRRAKARRDCTLTA